MVKYLLGIALAVAVLHCDSMSIENVNQSRNSLRTVCYNQNGILVPMAGSCSGFFICINGNAIASSCGDFYHFNARTGHCDHPANAACYNHVPLHTEFIRDEQQTETNLPTTFATNSPSLPKPKHPDEVVADLSAGDICRNKETGTLLAKSDSCAQYYVCILERPYRRTCPPMLHFNATRRLCQDPNIAQCFTPFQIAPVDEPITAAPVSNEYHLETACASAPVDELMPHPMDCRKFVYCTRPAPTELLCPAGLYFSKRYHRCVWPTMAKCTLPIL